MYWIPITLASVLKLKKRFQLSGAPGTGWGALSTRGSNARPEDEAMGGKGSERSG